MQESRRSAWNRAVKGDEAGGKEVDVPVFLGEEIQQSRNPRITGVSAHSLSIRSNVFETGSTDWTNSNQLIDAPALTNSMRARLQTAGGEGEVFTGRKRDVDKLQLVKLRAPYSTFVGMKDDTFPNQSWRNASKTSFATIMNRLVVDAVYQEGEHLTTVDVIAATDTVGDEATLNINTKVPMAILVMMELCKRNGDPPIMKYKAIDWKMSDWDKHNDFSKLMLQYAAFPALLARHMDLRRMEIKHGALANIDFTDETCLKKEFSDWFNAGSTSTDYVPEFYCIDACWFMPNTQLFQPERFLSFDLTHSDGSVYRDSTQYKNAQIVLKNNDKPLSFVVSEEGEHINASSSITCELYNEDESKFEFDATWTASASDLICRLNNRDTTKSLRHVEITVQNRKVKQVKVDTSEYDAKLPPEAWPFIRLQTVDFDAGHDAFISVPVCFVNGTSIVYARDTPLRMSYTLNNGRIVSDTTHGATTKSGITPFLYFSEEHALAAKRFEKDMSGDDLWSTWHAGYEATISRAWMWSNLVNWKLTLPNPALIISPSIRFKDKKEVLLFSKCAQSPNSWLSHMVYVDGVPYGTTVDLWDDTQKNSIAKAAKERGVDLNHVSNALVVAVDDESKEMKYVPGSNAAFHTGIKHSPFSNGSVILPRAFASKDGHGILLQADSRASAFTLFKDADHENVEIPLAFVNAAAPPSHLKFANARLRHYANPETGLDYQVVTRVTWNGADNRSGSWNASDYLRIFDDRTNELVGYGKNSYNPFVVDFYDYKCAAKGGAGGGFKEVPEWMLTTLVDNLTGEALTTAHVEGVKAYITFGFRRQRSGSNRPGQSMVGSFTNEKVEQFYGRWSFANDGSSPYELTRNRYTDAYRARDACIICVKDGGVEREENFKEQLELHDKLYSNITPLVFFSNPADFSNPAKLIPMIYMESAPSFFSYKDKSPFNTLVLSSDQAKVIVMGLKRDVTWKEPRLGYKWLDLFTQNPTIYEDRASIEDDGNLRINWDKARCRINENNEVEFDDPFDVSGRPIRFFNFKSTDASVQFQAIMREPQCDTMFLRSNADSIRHIGRLTLESSTIQPKVVQENAAPIPPSGVNLGHYQFEQLRDAFIFKQEGFNYTYYRNTIPGAFQPRHIPSKQDTRNIAVTRDRLNICVNRYHLQPRPSGLSEPNRYIELRNVGNSPSTQYVHNPTFSPQGLVVSETTPILVQNGSAREWFINQYKARHFKSKKEAAFKAAESRIIDLAKLPRATATPSGYIQVGDKRPAFTHRDVAVGTRVDYMQKGSSIRGYKPIDGDWEWLRLPDSNGAFNVMGLHTPTDIYCTPIPGESHTAASSIALNVCSYHETGYIKLNSAAHIKGVNNVVLTPPPFLRGKDWKRGKEDGLAALTQMGVYDLGSHAYPDCNDSFTFGNMLLQLMSLGSMRPSNKNTIPQRKPVPNIRPDAWVEVADGNQYVFGIGIISISNRGMVTGDGHTNFLKREWHPFKRMFDQDDEERIFKPGRFLRVYDQMFRIGKVLDDTSIEVEFDPSVHYAVSKCKSMHWGVMINAPTRQPYENRFLPTMCQVQSVEHQSRLEVKGIGIVKDEGDIRDPVFTNMPYWTSSPHLGKYLILHAKAIECNYSGTWTTAVTNWNDIFIEDYDATGTIIRISGEDFVITGTDEELHDEDQNVTRLLTNTWRSGTGTRPYLCVKPPHNIHHVDVLLKDSSYTYEIVRDFPLQCDITAAAQGGGSLYDVLIAQHPNLETHMTSNIDAAGQTQAIRNAATSPDFTTLFGTTTITFKTTMRIKENIVLRIVNPCHDEVVDLESGMLRNAPMSSNELVTYPRWIVEKDFDANPPTYPYFSDLHVKTLKGEVRLNQMGADMLRARAFNAAQPPRARVIVGDTPLLSDLDVYKGVKPHTNYIQVAQVRTDDGSIRVGKPKWIGPDEPVPWLPTNIVVFQDKVYTNAKPLDAYNRVNAAVFETMSGNITEFHPDDEYGIVRQTKSKPVDPTHKKPLAYQYSLVLPASMVTNMLLVSPTGTGKAIMMYLIGRMYHDYRVAASTDTMLSFIVKDSTIEQMAGEIFEQQSWADIPQKKLHRMTCIHHTDTEAECTDVINLMKTYEYYDDIQEIHKHVLSDAFARACSVTPYTIDPNTQHNDLTTQISAKIKGDSLPQKDHLHIVSMSELEHLYAKNRTHGEGQLYLRYKGLDPKASSTAIINSYNAASQNRRVHERAPDILQKMIVEGYFCIDEVHELSETGKRWIRDMLDVRRSELRKRPDIKSRCVGLTATTASSREELVSMLQLSAVAGSAQPLINTISNDDDGTDFMGASFVDKRNNRFRLDGLRRLDMDEKDVKMKPFIRGVVQRRAYDMYAHFDIQPLKFGSNGAYDYLQLQTALGLGAAGSYDNPEFQYEGPEHPVSMKEVPMVRIEDLEEARDNSKPYTSLARRTLLNQVEQGLYQVPAIVAHDRGKGFLEDARLYKGIASSAVLPPQGRSYTLNAYGSFTTGEPHDLFKWLHNDIIGAGKRLYTMKHKQLIHDCAIDAQKAREFYRQGRYIDPDTLNLEYNPEYVYNHLAVSDARFEYGSKRTAELGSFFQSNMLVFVKIQQKDAWGKYNANDVYIFKNSLKTPMVSIPKGGWEAGSVFGQADVGVEMHGNMTFQDNVAVNSEPAQANRVMSIHVRKGVSGSETQHSVTYASPEDLPREKWTKQINAGLQDLRNVRNTETNILSFKGEVVSVEERVGGRVLFKDAGNKYYIVSNFVDAEVNGAVTLAGREAQLFDSDDTPPYYRPNNNKYIGMKEEDRTLRFLIDEPYFKNEKDIQYKCLKLSTSTVAQQYTDDARTDFGNLSLPARADIQVPSTHEFVHSDDTFIPELGILLYSYDGRLYYLEEPPAFLKERMSHKTIIKIQPLKYNQTAYEHDGQVKLVYNTLHTPYMNVNMKDSTQLKIDRIISSRVNNLTAANDELLKELVAMKYEGCNAFADKDSYEEWDPTYFNSASDPDAANERTARIAAFTESFRSLVCVSYFSMMLMDNDQYASITYANNRDNQIVARQYGECEQNTKVILMMLQASLAEKVSNIQFGRDATLSSAKALSRQLFFQGELGPMTASKVRIHQKELLIFEALKESLFTEVRTILKYSSRPMKTAMWVKKLEHAKRLKEYICDSKNDKRRYFTSEDANLECRISIREDGSVKKNLAHVRVVWPFIWHKSKRDTTLTRHMTCVSVFANENEFATGASGQPYGQTTLTGTLQMLSPDSKRILIQTETGLVGLLNPLHPEFATQTFLDDTFFPEKFKEQRPWETYPRIGDTNVHDIYEPLYIGVSKEQDLDDTVFLKKHVGSTFEIVDEKPDKIVWLFQKLVPVNEVEAHCQTNTVSMRDEFRQENSRTITFLVTIDKTDGAKIVVTLISAGLFPTGFLSTHYATTQAGIGSVLIDATDPDMTAHMDSACTAGSDANVFDTKVTYEIDMNDEAETECVHKLKAWMKYGGSLQETTPTGLWTNVAKKCVVRFEGAFDSVFTKDPYAMSPLRSITGQHVVLAVQEQSDGSVFHIETNKLGSVQQEQDIHVFKNPKAVPGAAGTGLDRFNSKGLPWGNKDGLLIADTDNMKSSLDFMGVRVLIKFGFMTYLDAKQVDGRARRLNSHNMLQKEDRNVTQYLIIPYSGYDTPTCAQKYHSLVCRQTSFFQTLNDIMMQLSLSKEAVDAYGHEDKEDTKIKVLKAK